jgi:hypothetical protein
MGYWRYSVYSREGEAHGKAGLEGPNARRAKRNDLMCLQPGNDERPNVEHPNIETSHVEHSSSLPRRWRSKATFCFCASAHREMSRLRLAFPLLSYTRLGTSPRVALLGGAHSQYTLQHL